MKVIVKNYISYLFLICSAFAMYRKSPIAQPNKFELPIVKNMAHNIHDNYDGKDTKILPSINKNPHYRSKSVAENVISNYENIGYDNKKYDYFHDDLKDTKYNIVLHDNQEFVISADKINSFTAINCETHKSVQSFVLANIVPLYDQNNYKVIKPIVDRNVIYNTKKTIEKFLYHEYFEEDPPLFRYKLLSAKNICYKNVDDVLDDIDEYIERHHIYYNNFGHNIKHNTNYDQSSEYTKYMLFAQNSHSYCHNVQNNYIHAFREHRAHLCKECQVNKLVTQHQDDYIGNLCCVFFVNPFLNDEDKTLIENNLLPIYDQNTGQIVMTTENLSKYYKIEQYINTMKNKNIILFFIKFAGDEHVSFKTANECKKDLDNYHNFLKQKIKTAVNGLRQNNHIKKFI